MPTNLEAAIAQHGHAVTTIRGYRESHWPIEGVQPLILKLRPPLQITLFFTVGHLLIGIGNAAKYEKDAKGYKTLHTAILFLYLAKVKWCVWAHSQDIIRNTISPIFPIFTGLPAFIHPQVSYRLRLIAHLVVPVTLHRSYLQ